MCSKCLLNLAYYHYQFMVFRSVKFVCVHKNVVKAKNIYFKMSSYLSVLNYKALISLSSLGSS